jgi:3-deoxy-D-manno-octulosonic-acid transferase
MFFQLLIYNMLFPLFFILYLPFYLHKQMKRGGMDSSFWERFGFFSEEKKHRLSSQEGTVWIHAVSVGETIVALTFIEKWCKLRPLQNFVLSTTTTTGQAIARKKSNSKTEVIYMPLDFRGALRRAFKLISPQKLVIFEVEIWPNLMHLARKNGVELSLVNGRMSDNSLRGFSRFSWFFVPVFGLFNKICVQSQADADRFNAVSHHKVQAIVCDTMKFDQAPSVQSHFSRQTIESRLVGKSEVIFLAASTHAGEEELILDAFQSAKSQCPELGLILVPRHVERTKEIEKVITQKGMSYGLFTDQAASPKDLLLVNVTGELLSLIACSDLVYVGKSMAGNEGGHNIIEPAVFGKAILHGINMQNFKLVTQIFQEAGASVLVTEENMAEQIERLALHPSERHELGQRALEVVSIHAGAVDETIRILES